MGLGYETPTNFKTQKTLTCCHGFKVLCLGCGTTKIFIPVTADAWTARGTTITPAFMSWGQKLELQHNSPKSK